MEPIYEHLPLGNQRSIQAFHYEQERFATPWHFHPQHELTLIQESSGTKLVGDYVGSYQPGELVLLRSHLPHCWKNQHQEGVLARSTVVQWTPGIYTRVPELAALFELLHAASRGLLFEREAATSLLPLLTELPKLDGARSYTTLLELLVGLSGCPYRPLSKERFTEEMTGAYGNRMIRVQAYVAANFQQKIYLREVAHLVNLTEQSFSRFFSKMMGRPFTTYLNEYRINAASRMLLNTDKSAAEVAYSCGYESLPYFFQQFKRLHGTSPGKYRKQHLAR